MKFQLLVIRKTDEFLQNVPVKSDEGGDESHQAKEHPRG